MVCRAIIGFMKGNLETKSRASKIIGFTMALIKICLFFSLILNSADILAESSRDAFTQTFKAIKKTPVVKELIQVNKQKFDGKLKEVNKFVGENAVALVALGVVTKLVIDGRAAYKAKIDKNTAYVLNADITGEFSTGISGKIDSLKDSKYDVTAFSRSGDQGMRVGLNFNFD